MNFTNSNHRVDIFSAVEPNHEILPLARIIVIIVN